MDGGVSEALTAGAGIMSGVGGLMGDNQAATNAKNAAGLARVQANQTDMAYRQDLQKTLGNIRAVRASAGVGTDSPTGQAIEANQQQMSDRNRTNAVTGKRMDAQSDDAAAGAYQRAGAFALGGGVAKGLSSLEWN